MWAIIEVLVLIALVLVFITEFFWPLLNGKPLFGSFRRTKKDFSLEEKIKVTKQKVAGISNEVNEIKSEADSNLKTAEELKKETDNLL